MRSTLRVGARGSSLAIAQANEVINKIKFLFPHIKFDIVPILTSGDIKKDVSLSKIGGKGLFIKEIELALLNNDIDIAVHSAKDIPSIEVSELMIPCAINRVSPYDVFVSEKYQKISMLPNGAIIGTCSIRRKVQLLKMNNTLNIVPLRGNLGTRLGKLSEFDGIVLAEAGLRRIGFGDVISEVLTEEQMLSAVGQGIICAQCRASDMYVRCILEAINHNDSYIELIAERYFMKAINGSCDVPLAALARLSTDNIVRFHCMLSGSNGIFFAKAEIPARIEDIKRECWNIGLKLKNQVGDLGSND